MARRSSARIRCAGVPSEGNERTPRWKNGAPSGIVDDFAIQLDRHPGGISLAFRPPAIISRDFANSAYQTRCPVNDRDEMADRPVLFVSLSGQLMTPCVPFKATSRPMMRAGSGSRRSERKRLPAGLFGLAPLRAEPRSAMRTARVFRLCQPFRERRERTGCRYGTSACLTNRARRAMRDNQPEHASGP